MNLPSMVDRPFGCPPDPRPIVLDIPLPPSVNRTRKVDWAAQRKYNAWRREAGFHLIANGQYRVARLAKFERYELTITLDRVKCRLDPDNPIKAAIDLIKSLEIIPDDSPKFAERIVIEWGEAPDGCRLTLRGRA